MKTLCALITSLGIAATAHAADLFPEPKPVPAIMNPFLDILELKEPELGEGRYGPSAASFYGHLEIPRSFRLDLLKLRLRKGRYSVKMSDEMELEDVEYDGRLLSDYFDHLTAENYRDQITVGEYTFGELEDAFREESKRFPDFARRFRQHLKQRLDEFTEDDIDYDHSLFPGEILDYQSLWVHFLHLLSDPGEDGVLSPFEVYKVGNELSDHLDSYVDDELTDEQKAEIERVARELYEKYGKEFEDMIDEYGLDERITSLANLKDIGSEVMIGPYPLQLYIDMFNDLDPLIKLEYTDDHLKITGRIYGAYEKKNDLFSSVVFDDFTFRYGTHSHSRGYGLADIDLSVEIVAGDEIKFFDKYDKNRREYELLRIALGYTPHFMEIVSTGHVSIEVDDVRSIMKGYELFPEGDEWGFSIASEWRIREQSRFKVDASGRMDPFGGEVEAEVDMEVYQREQRGRVNYAYLIRNIRASDHWISLSAGAKHGLFDEELSHEIYRARYHLDLDGKEEFHEEHSKKEHDKLRSILSGLVSFQGGVTLPHVSTYVFVDSLREEAGVGAMINTRYLSSHLKGGAKGFFKAHSLLSINGTIDEEVMDKYFRMLQEHGSSLFPARDAVLLDAKHDLYAHLDGVMIETSVDRRDFRYYRYMPPALLGIGVLSAGLPGYFRGGLSVNDTDHEVAGVYMGGGAESWGVDFSLSMEKIDSRKTKANSVALSAYADFSSCRLRTVVDIGEEEPDGYRGSLSKPQFFYSIMLELL